MWKKALSLPRQSLIIPWIQTLNNLITRVKSYGECICSFMMIYENALAGFLVKLISVFTLQANYEILERIQNMIFVSV